MVDTTGQPYVFVNDSPLNATDPLGLCSWYNPICAVTAAAKWVVHHPMTVVVIIAVGASIVATGGADAAFVGLTYEASASATAVFETAGTIATTASYVSAGGDAVSCVATKLAGACVAAVASLFTAGLGSLNPTSVAWQSGQKAITATFGTGSTALDFSIAVAHPSKSVVVKKKKK